MIFSVAEKLLVRTPKESHCLDFKVFLFLFCFQDGGGTVSFRGSQQVRWGGIAWNSDGVLCIIAFNNALHNYTDCYTSSFSLRQSFSGRIPPSFCYSPPSVRACTILGSALLPSLNSSSVKRSSWFLSIWSNILSTRFCGVFSSSDGCWP